MIDPASIQYELSMLLRVLIAMVLGALIGLDREFAEKPAGLRTHMLVAGAASLLVSLSDAILIQLAMHRNPEMVSWDPTRIMYAVVTGISFLGAGTIIRTRSGGEVEGLTTAASIMIAASVGIAVALDQFIAAAGTTVLVLIILRALGALASWFQRRGT